MDDQRIDIAVGASKNSLKWKNQKWTWEKLAKKLCNGRRTSETIKEYLKYNKEDRDSIKDVGGFVGGYLVNGRRKTDSVLHRQLLTLDLDFAYHGFWDFFQMIYSEAAVLHTTHSHTKEKPRYRLIMPLSREVTPDEYIAISRRVAGDLDIDLFDKTTFEVNRLMYWASVSSDGIFEGNRQKGKWLDPDKVLARYVDWKDSSSYPTSANEEEQLRKESEKQEDPESKKGMVGIFCRTYSVTEAIEEFLTQEYEVGADGRYTYTKGSTSSGLVIYDDKFAFSHHGTDPTSGKLTNAFDLVRIHKYGHLDTGNATGEKTKSYSLMMDLCKNAPQVKKTITQEKLADASYDFADDLDESEFDAIEEKDDLKWAEHLEVDSKGKYLSSASNITLIMRYDPDLRGAFKDNLFDQKPYVFKNLPWRKIDKPEPLKNVDLSGVRNFIESVYGISAVTKIEDCLHLESWRNRYHPIRDYLESLEWDGTPRLDYLLHNYFGTPDNIYTREAIRKMLVAAVTRVYDMGAKFDLVLVLIGDQGTGKSTFISTLGKQWFSDSFHTLKDKTAFEQLQGAWLIEMAELSGLRRAQVEVVKHFISKQKDIFRPAFGRLIETYPRQCVFFATTNESNFLKDHTGNRRFMPVDVITENIKTSVLSGKLKKQVDQIWAEAYHLFQLGEPLKLSEEAEKIARLEQQNHSEIDERKGVIQEYLNTFLPDDWESLDIFERRDYLADSVSVEGSNIREFVCIAEIWCECFSRDKKEMDRYKTREINELMKSLNGWEYAGKSTKRFKLYGHQKYFKRRNI